ncbi:hypothetical protein D9611_005128 [Ephemerocybe angulata]|uniref:ATP synthase F(0) complex subunit e, mitochondrial n=2 Tax=Ephemerocybe angulata TaxID=980116 RepID=A0A8H5C0R0_9AGAR|nr:hypothetical protein D9611_005128 [Tulosesus angulatus]KAF6754237.1 ATP synthase E chain-domain-containing protein [Tulosesus angulatus]
MVSSTVNVVRYSALFSGILYGWYHHRTLQATANQHKVEHAIHHREKLIQEAKAAWKRKNEALSSIVTDPENPNFDLEKLLATWD